MPGTPPASVRAPIRLGSRAGSDVQVVPGDVTMPSNAALIIWALESLSRGVPPLTSSTECPPGVNAARVAPIGLDSAVPAPPLSIRMRPLQRRFLHLRRKAPESIYDVQRPTAAAMPARS